MKKFLSGVLIGAFVFGISAADIQIASAASHHSDYRRDYRHGKNHEKGKTYFGKDENNNANYHYSKKDLERMKYLRKKYDETGNERYMREFRRIAERGLSDKAVDKKNTRRS